MAYENSVSGRVEDHPSDCGREALGAGFLTFEDVEERLVEAMANWRRMPDRERGWHQVKALWPELARHSWRMNVDGEFDEREAEPVARRPGLTRDEISDMTAASEWMAYVGERDRKLVTTALAAKASGSGRVRWEAIWKGLGKGRPGPEGLQMRYRRAIATICQRVNSAENREGGLSS